MKRKPILNFFDIASEIDQLPENELFKLKGGDSDIAWETEGPEIDVYPPEGSGDDDNWDDGGDDDWEDPWDDGNDEDFEDYDDLGDGGIDNNPDNDPDADKLPELCFDAIWDAYPHNVNGQTQHPSQDDYANQCAIRVGAALKEVYDVDFGSYGTEFDDPLSSEGYPIRAANLKNYLVDDYKSKGMESQIKTYNSTNAFLDSASSKLNGIVYMQRGGVNHIDVFKGDEGKNEVGSLWLSGNVDKVIFIPIDNSACQ
ncbi:T6SS effector amidase Tae4 family protein [Sphingobacterium siyangense]|uniref:T6SS effector amidase Tae4 family protein n=1 Tax=Sphingobacterium siyangense TaxID=459529 RepID=UPI003DA5B6FB